MEPLRVVVFDRTCVGPPLGPGLSHAWRVGRHLYRGLGRIDASFGAADWDEALAWLEVVASGGRLAEVQYWGHGKWGRVRIGTDVLDGSALEPGHPLHEGLLRLRDRLLHGDRGLFWLRTCETFGRDVGQRFAAGLAGLLDCRAAGHTYVIHAIQSGLHSLAPGDAPRWSPSEGLPEGPGEPAVALLSAFGAPHTITCLHGRVPAGW